MFSGTYCMNVDWRINVYIVLVSPDGVSMSSFLFLDSSSNSLSVDPSSNPLSVDPSSNPLSVDPSSNLLS